MTTRELTIASLTALATAGGVYMLDRAGSNERVVLVDPTSESDVELKTPDAATLKAEIERAGAATDAHCELVEFSNYSGCYCWSGKTGGWPTESVECLDKVTVRDGKVWARDMVR